MAVVSNGAHALSPRHIPPSAVDAGFAGDRGSTGKSPRRRATNPSAFIRCSARASCWHPGAEGTGRGEAMNARTKLFLGLACGMALLAFDAYAAETLAISQKKRTFNPSEITIRKGDMLHIANDDLFTHQVYVDDAAFKFESAEAAPGANVDIKFTATGSFDVLCHIHPKMKLHVSVQ
jgi:plastocyanin